MKKNSQQEIEVATEEKSVDTEVCVLLVEKGDDKIMVTTCNESRLGKVLKPLSCKYPSSKDEEIVMLQTMTNDKFGLSGIATKDITKVGNFTLNHLNFHVFWVKIKKDTPKGTKNIQIKRGTFRYISTKDLLNHEKIKINGLGIYEVPKSIKSSIILMNSFKQKN